MYLHTSILDTNDSLFHSNTSQIWIRRKSLPIPSTQRRSSQRACNRSVHTLKKKIFNR